MNEMITVYQATLAMVGLTLACFFYSWGGRSGKWKRRFIGSLILACTVNGLCVWRGIFNPWMLLVYPLLIGGFSMGYGDKGRGGYVKLVRRTIYAIGVLSSGFLMAFLLGGNAYYAMLPHIGVGLWSIYLGYKNPYEAAAEEVFVCALLNIGLVAYPFVGRI